MQSVTRTVSIILPSKQVVHAFVLSQSNPATFAGTYSGIQGVCQCPPAAGSSPPHFRNSREQAVEQLCADVAVRISMIACSVGLIDIKHLLHSARCTNKA